MLRSMFSGVSALRNHQTQMDVIGNNIANVNTIGFKASRASFQDTMSQMIRDASRPQGHIGGTNPIQVGLGSSLAAINVIHTPGNPQTTGVLTDLSIQGNGFFILANGQEQFFTRAGMFDVDRDGSLVSPGGLKVMGWNADRNGNINTGRPVEALRIPADITIDPLATTEIVYEGNLDAGLNGSLSLPNPTVTITDSSGATVNVTVELTSTGNFNEFQWTLVADDGTWTPAGPPSGIIQLNAAGEIVSQSMPMDVTLDLGSGGNPITLRPPQVGQTAGLFSWDSDGDSTFDGQTTMVFEAPEARITPIRVYDSLGNPRDVMTELVKVGDNTWEWIAKDVDGNVLNVGGVPGILQFDSNGHLIAQTGEIAMPAMGGSEALAITPNFEYVMQTGGDMTVLAVEQDGYPVGTLTSFGVDANGVIIGSFTNGLSKQIGQVALATFVNPAGLRKSGDTMYEVSSNSGEARIGVAGFGANGTIAGGQLEMSNVDLSQEFTNMIITQRGFQANSRIITTSDEMLQELVNLKR